MISKIFIFGFLLIGTVSWAQQAVLHQDALERIKTLKGLIVEAEAAGIDTQKEQMTARTAEVFLKYALWDEANPLENERYYKNLTLYKKNAAEMATKLPDFERHQVIELLDSAKQHVELLLQKKEFRKPTPKVDWHHIVLDGNTLKNEGRPVFLSDYTWKPEISELEDYFGQLDGQFLSLSYLENERGVLNSKILQQIKSKPSGTAGFVFINNTQLPDWAIQKYGPELGKFQGKPFTLYDIDHPAARKLMHLLLAKTVPLMKNKNYSQLGYMLCNEPRWINYKDGNKKVWYSDSVSHYTLDKFRGWLAQKHGTIQALNRVWGTQFEDFKEVSIDNPIDITQQGQPQWYDWRIFNQERVVDWFAFMKTEIKNKDPKAKVHLKIMPSFFTDNTPISGIDLEALTAMSDISGNDVAAMYNDLRGKGSSWEKRYAFDWRELFMSYDFMKSVSPDHIIFNTESHLLSSAHSRDLYMNPAYARAVFWAAHTLGLNASQIWYWPRREDGSIKKHYDSNGYAGSNNQQPAVTHEVQATMMDLNTYSEIITDMQQQRKPLRIFYSGTSAAQRSGYMDDLFDAYESLNFEGIPLGFVTQNILNGQKAEGWDVVLIYKTERVTQLELKALQKYIEKGGVVLADHESLRYDEYGRKIQDLAWFSGLRRVNSLMRMKEIAMELLKEKRQLPPVSVREVNPLGVKTCTWKVVGMPGGGQAVSIINLGKSASTITLEGSAIKRCTNLLNGKPMAVTQRLQPFQVLFVQLD